MTDQILTCKDCGQQFTWTVSEQEFYASKGFSAPVRCPECRRKLKEQKQGGTSGRFDRGPRQMHQITCANCGAKGEVPFEPRDPSNVLCADCFRQKRDAERGGGMGHTHTPASTPAAAPSDDMSNDSASTDDSSNTDSDNNEM